MGIIYGAPRVKVETDVVDRIGLRTLVLSKMWSPSRGDLTQEELDAEAPEVPPVSGGVILIGEQTRQGPGGMKTTWTFEGIKGNGKTVTFKGREDSLDYGFEPGFSQVSIKRLPQFHELLEDYGGTFDNEGNVIWPAEIPEQGPAKNGLEGGKVLLHWDADTSGKNPMFGVEDFFRVEGTYRFRYLATSLPGDRKNRVGHSMPASALPGEPEHYSDRDYLKLPVLWRRRGYIYELTEMYWLSGEGKWPAPVYRFRAS